MGRTYILFLLIFSLVFFHSLNTIGGEYRIADIKLLNPLLVNEVYKLNQNKLLWVNPILSFFEVKDRFLKMLDSAEFDGLVKEKYHFKEVENLIIPSDSIGMVNLDRLFTDALISYFKDLHTGANIPSWISNDEVSTKFKQKDDEFLCASILKLATNKSWEELYMDFVQSDKNYLLLKVELHKQIALHNSKKTEQLVVGLNLYRWMHHFRFGKFVVVNIPAATLQYYENESMLLKMKVVVGKPRTRSPRFSTWCYQVILYPYWNVPKSIGLNELLPRIKKNPSLMTSMDMQLIGRNGNVVDHTGIAWSKFNRSNFPYTFRQCTGCDNSLGVVKFNLTDPFSVYLHDTNFKLAFLKDTRFLSHGCIRVEKPIELANYLLEGRIDSVFLKACLKNQKPVILNLNEQVPVFVTYMPAEASADSVAYFKDVYRLFAN